MKKVLIVLGGILLLVLLFGIIKFNFSDNDVNTMNKNIDSNQDRITEKKELKEFNFGKEKLRAVHMGGNWGGNTYGIENLNTEYFDYLHKINADWVGISVALHVKDSLDSNVKRRYSNVFIPTLTDEKLKELISTLHESGFHVYLTLAFESDDETRDTENPVERYQFGDSNAVETGEIRHVESWPWDLNHPEHKSFVNEFFRTYTAQAVHFARLAQELDVEMYSLGTETDRLFRTRSNSEWKDNFKIELQKMIKEVRNVYSGKLTYTMNYAHILNPSDPYFEGSKFLWQDLDLDIVGISAYFPLVETENKEILSVDFLEKKWEKIFRKYLIPLKEQNPQRPIIFTEFGYVTAINSPFNPASEERRDSVLDLVDKNNDGLDDAQEQQANIYESFFNTMKKHPQIVDGAFLWGEGFLEEDYLDIWGTRQKLAEQVVKDNYLDLE